MIKLCQHKQQKGICCALGEKGCWLLYCWKSVLWSFVFVFFILSSYSRQTGDFLFWFFPFWWPINWPPHCCCLIPDKWDLPHDAPIRQVDQIPYFIGTSSFSDCYGSLWLVHYKLHGVSRDLFYTWNITRQLSCIMLQRAAKFISTKNVLYVAEWPTLTLMHKWVGFPFLLRNFLLFSVSPQT